jgi:hypothetical protein
VTLGDVLVRYLLANLAVFAIVAGFFSAVSLLIGCWIGAAWQSRRSARPVGLGSWDTSDWLAESGTTFEPGVARVGGDR